MDFSENKKMKIGLSKNHFKLVVYLSILILELFFINQMSDLSPSIGNWIGKAEDLAAFRVPSNNFYGPGAALMLVPFLWAKDQLFLIILFYFLLGAIAYWKIAIQITISLGRFLALAALPLNFYLLWLINSSQDTVFEFCLLLWAIFFLLKRQYINFSALAFLLTLTRAGYWTFFLGTSVLLFASELIRRKKINLKKILAVPLLLTISIFNFVNFGSPSPALEGGVTAYFSYSKYHYLALPKMDMDVFLSGPKGIFSDEFGVNPVRFKSGAESNSEFQKVAIKSALEHKKETLLGWMQKLDSYLFDVQKVPHLPGRYVLNLETKTIKIENERLTWTLVIGNFVFFLYRIVLFTAGLLAVGMVVFHNIVFRKFDRFTAAFWGLSLPYVFGLIPGILFYTETRFKIVSELILVPLVVGIWSSMLTKKPLVTIN